MGRAANRVPEHRKTLDTCELWTEAQTKTRTAVKTSGPTMGPEGKYKLDHADVIE